MSEGSKNKPVSNTGPSLAGVAQTCAQTSSDLKGLGAALNELTKTVSALQESASATHSQAVTNLKTIQANAEAIQDIKGTTSLIQERQEAQNSGLNECLTRIESLEKNQNLFRLIDDQDAKIHQLERKISPAEFAKGSCIITLHGIPLPRSISEMDINNPSDVNIIANAFMEGLGRSTAEFIFASDEEGGFANMAAWARIPENDNFKYSPKSPEIARNSVIFYFKNRVQTIQFEVKIRGALISTQKERKAGNFGFLEMAIYSESSRVRALKNLMLYKGRILVENLDQFSHYRIAWRGGSAKSQAPAKLVLELKASQEFMEVKKRDYFFDKDKTLIRNAWTDQSNIKLSEPDQTWFSKKPEINLRAESQLGVSATPKQGQTVKRARESPGLAGNVAKQSGSFPCRSCEKSFRSKVGLNEHIKEHHDLEQDQSSEEVRTVALVSNRGDDEIQTIEEEIMNVPDEEEDDGFSPPNTKKDKKLAGRKNKLGIRGSGTPKATSFSLHAPIPDLQKQKKITSSFASIAKKPTPSMIPNAMPMPKIFSKNGE